MKLQAMFGYAFFGLMRFWYVPNAFLMNHYHASYVIKTNWFIKPFMILNLNIGTEC